VEHKQEQAYQNVALVDGRAKRLEALLRQLIRVFGEFSAIALQLIQRLLRTELEIYALLKKVQNGLTPRPASSVQDSIHFTDALGRTQELPYQWFRHWDVFKSMLKCEFKNLPGEQRVLKRQFHILNTRNPNLFIDEAKWERSTFPGSQTTMSMIMYGILFQAFKTIHIQTIAPGIINPFLKYIVPLPRLSGAIFSSSGHLACFFFPENGKPNHCLIIYSDFAN